MMRFYVDYDPVTKAATGAGCTHADHVEEGPTRMIVDSLPPSVVGMAVDAVGRRLIPYVPAKAVPRYPDKGTAIVRLGPPDIQGMRAILASREKLWTAEDGDYATVTASMTSDLFLTYDFVGLYHDGVLDGIMALQYPHREDYEGEDCCILTYNFTLKREGRPKTVHGWDRHNTLLGNALVDMAEEKGKYTHWLLLPTKFNNHAKNPDSKHTPRYDRESVETIPAGSRAQGEYCSFINRYLARRKYVEDVVARKCVLRPEFRPK